MDSFGGSTPIKEILRTFGTERTVAVWSGGVQFVVVIEEIVEWPQLEGLIKTSAAVTREYEDVMELFLDDEA